jgi:hypothetical protein
MGNWPEIAFKTAIAIMFASVILSIGHLYRPTLKAFVPKWTCYVLLFVGFVLLMQKLDIFNASSFTAISVLMVLFVHILDYFATKNNWDRDKM